MRKLLLDHFISCSTFAKEFEEHFLPLLSCSVTDSAETITDIVNLGPSGKNLLQIRCSSFI